MSEFQNVVNEGKKSISKFFKRLLLAFLGLGILVFAIYLIQGYGVVAFSDGVRAGNLIKLSNKGVLLKTYEGQLSVGGFQNNPQDGLSNIWEFSVPSTKIYKELQDYQGKSVKLHYHQVYSPLPWVSKTDYLVHKVELVE